MTIQEYSLKLSQLQIAHKKEIDALKKEFADMNSKVKLADMIESGGIRIQVDSIGYFTSIDAITRCRYSGFAFTKEGKQRKDKRRETIYQNDSIKIL